MCYKQKVKLHKIGEMGKLKNRIVILLMLAFLITACKQNEVKGIIIDSTLYTNQSISENKELRLLIEQTLNKDETALAKLSDFWCGGASGCYDLGFIVTQIIYKLGVEDFVTMVEKLGQKERTVLYSLIQGGPEYGDNDRDGKEDNELIENEFRALFILLQSKMIDEQSQNTHITKPVEQNQIHINIKKASVQNSKFIP